MTIEQKEELEKAIIVLADAIRKSVIALEDFGKIKPPSLIEGGITPSPQSLSKEGGEAVIPLDRLREMMEGKGADREVNEVFINGVRFIRDKSYKEKQA